VKTGLPVSAAPRGVAVHDLPLLERPGFRKKIAPAIGRPLTLAGLDEAAEAVTAWYRAHDPPFVDVAVPAQNISSGVVQIVVEEYRVGAVTVRGNRWFSSGLIRSESGIVPGRTPTLEGLQGDLDWLNRNPSRVVDLTLGPGAAEGATNATLVTHDRLPLHVYGTYDNEGVKGLGLSEWGAGFTWGNLAGLDQIFPTSSPARSPAAMSPTR
jgi:hemolysin activation/secretion protein